MKRKLTLYLILAILMFSGIGRAQDYRKIIQFEEILNYTEKKNNLYKLLVNGQSYVNIYRKAIGHPFFLDNNFVKGEVVYSGIKFPDQSIKFSSYEQKLVLKLELENISQEIVLPIELVDEFTIKNYLFRKYSLFDSSPEYYQVVGETEGLTCIYLWTKDREESDHLGGYLSYEFGDDKAKKYLLSGGDAVTYKTNRSFIRLFPKDLQKQVSEYLKENKIRMKKAKDIQVQNLLDFCQVNLDQSGTQF